MSEIWIQELCTDKFRWVSLSSNPLCDAKGIGGTLGKNLTAWVVADLVLTCQEGIGNLTFDNCYAFYKCLSLLSTLNIPTICTLYGGCIGSAPITGKSQMEAVPYPVIFWGCRFFSECSKEKNCCAAGESGAAL